MADSSSTQAAGRKTRLPMIVAAVVAVLLLAACAGWWWLQQRDKAAALDEQKARLVALLEREKALATELASIKPVDPADCPPGERRQPVGTGTSPAPAMPAPASGPAASVTGAALPPLPTTGSAKALADSALTDRLELSTAMVLVIEGESLSTGTGFFIGPNLLVTNRHVVERSRDRVLLASTALGSARRATVLRTTSSSEVGSPDFALLRMDEGRAPGTLDATTDIGKLASVVAAGFPGFVLSNDPKFRGLLQGDMSLAPDLSLTQGAVQSLQTGAGGMPLILHTAAIAKGNSGGPLVDACGRLVGINTFINVDQSQSARVNYAIRSQVMQSFLQASGTEARFDPRPCTRG